MVVAIGRPMARKVDEVKRAPGWRQSVHVCTVEPNEKVNFVKQFAEQEGVPLSDDVATFIAMTTLDVVDVRNALKVRMIRLIAYASLSRQPLTLDLAQEVFSKTDDQVVH